MTLAQDDWTKMLVRARGKGLIKILILIVTVRDGD